jgi:hypothetical protein
LTSFCLYGVILTKFMPCSNEAAQFALALDLAPAPDAAVGQTLGRYKLLERVALKAIALGRATNPVCNGRTA